ncbi:MAG: hypothetical protein VX672_05395, partial [Planctomycetota bacterium]|nr:hypothetical protein [Planctomycetota bacterium]
MNLRITAAFGVALSSVACTPAIESDWKRIDALDERLGTISPFDTLGGVRERPASPPPSSETAAVARVENLLSLMSAGKP